MDTGQVKSSDLVQDNIFENLEKESRRLLSVIELLSEECRQFSKELDVLHLKQGKSYDDIVKLQTGAADLIAKQDMLIAARKEAALIEKELTAGQLRANKAATEAAKAEAKIRVDNARARAIENRETERQTKAIEKQAKAVKAATVNTNTWSKAVQSFQFKFNALGNVAGLLFDKAASAISSFGREIIDTTKQLNSIDMSMRAIFTDSLKLTQANIAISQSARETGHDVKQLKTDFIGFAASLKGTALEGEKGFELFNNLTKSMAVLGRGTEETKRAMIAVSQMATNGKIQAEELKGQLGDAMPGALKIMADALGVTVSKLTVMMKNGELLASDVLPKFSKQLEKTFSLDKVKQVDTLAAAQGRLANSFTQLIGGLGASGALKNFTNAIDAVVSSIARLVSDKPADEFAKVRTELILMQSKLNDTNTSQAERYEIITKLQEQYPLFLQNINKETVTNEQLNLALQGVNNALIMKIALQEKDDALNEQREDVATSARNAASFELSMLANIEKLERSRGLTIDKRLTTQQQALEVLKQTQGIEFELPSAKKGVVQIASEFKQRQELEFNLGKMNYYRKQLSDNNAELQKLEQEKIDFEKYVNKALGTANLEQNEILKKLNQIRKDDLQKGNDAIATAQSEAVKKKGLLLTTEYKMVKQQTELIEKLRFDSTNGLKDDSDLLDKETEKLNKYIKALENKTKTQVNDAKTQEKAQKVAKQLKDTDFTIKQKTNIDFYADNGLSTSKEEYERQMTAYLDSKENLSNFRKEQAIKDAETELQTAQQAYEKGKGLRLNEYADLVQAQNKLSDLKQQQIEENRKIAESRISPDGIVRADDPEYNTKMNNILAINEKASSEQIALKKSTNDELAKLDDEMLTRMKGRALDAVEGLAEMYSSYLTARAEYNEKVLQKQYDANQNTQQQLINATKEGSQEATEALLYEKQRAAEIQQQQLKNQEAQAKQQIFLALIQSVATEMRGGSSLPAAMTNAVASTAVLKGIAAAYPLSFFEGTDDTGVVAGADALDSNGGRFIVAHNNEKIFSAAQNAAMGFKSRDEVIDIVQSHDRGEIGSLAPMIAEIKELKQIVYEKPVQVGIDLDTIGQYFDVKMQSGNTERIIRKMLKK